MWIGVILSFVFVFAIILLATIIQKIFNLSAEFSRKIIHIGVGNWIFFIPFFFDTLSFAIIPPIAFIVINFISYKYKIFRAMELDDKNPGTIYYAISLAFLTILTFSRLPLLLYPYLGILAMCWGDGLAAVVGRRYPVKVLRNGKSLGGSAAFLVSTLISFFIYLAILGELNTGTIVLLAVAGMLVEFFSPKNLDNLTVPLIIGILGFLIESNMI
ncbi:hypothetical protein JXJ21_16530 [candidate division KSB1 bacterium]|nr:hypothetical protein [candidate division KSB1 bacterium]